jgi:hypothetical protein
MGRVGCGPRAGPSLKTGRRGAGVSLRYNWTGRVPPMSDANVIGNSSVRFLWMPHGTWEPTGVPKCSAGMAKIESVLAEVGELLAALTVEIQSASFEEMPALIDGAQEAVRLVITRCLTFDPVAELPPEAAAMLRTELVRLGEALQAQIAGIVEIRLTQLTGCVPSATLH